MTREALEGPVRLRHGKPHSWGGPELIYLSLPPSGGYRWYYNLHCSQAWLLRYIYIVYTLQIQNTPYKNLSEFLEKSLNL